MRVYCRSIGNRSKHALWLEKTSFASNASGDLSGQAPNPRLVARQTRMRARRRLRLRVLTDLSAYASPHPAFDRMRFLFTMSEIESRTERRRTEILSPAIRPSSRQALARSTKLINRIGKDRKHFRWLPARRGPQGAKPWWSQTGSNRRPHACKARALPTELWPRFKIAGAQRPWWAWEDLNLRPHAYQARALTN